MKKTTKNTTYPHNVELKFRFDDFELVDGKPTYDIVLELYCDGKYQNEFEIIDKIEMENNSHLNEELINEIMDYEFVDYIDSFHKHIVKKYSIK